MKWAKGMTSGFFAMVLFAVCVMCCLQSCRRYVGDEQAVGKALAVADSLRYDEPEVTDSIVRSLDADSLGSRANAALYALLANEINLYDGRVVEADSVADIAVDYYRLRQWFSENNRHHYARALMQKAIQQSVDDEDADAISTYKLASELIDTINCTDFNLVADAYYILASIYANAYSPKKEYLVLYKRANHFYTLADNKRKSAICLCLIGAYYRGVDMDSAYKYMNASLHLSRHIGDSATVIRNLTHIERAYYIQGRYEECKQRCHYILSQSADHVVKNEVLFDLSKAYARLGILDSAEYYKSQMAIDIGSPIDRYKIYSVNEVLSLSRGDNLAAYHYLDSASKLSAQLTSDSKLMQMHKIREKYDYTKLKLKNQELYSWMSVCIIVISLGITIAIYLMFRIRRRRYETELFIHRLKQSLSDYESDIAQHIIDNKTLSLQIEQLRESNQKTDIDKKNSAQTDLLIAYLSAYISETKKACNYACEVSAQNSSKFITQFQKEIDRISLPTDFVSVLKDYVNHKYDNILDEIENTYEFNDEKKISIIALNIIGFSREMICTILDIPNKGTLATTISRMNKKERNGATFKDFLNSRIGRSI